MLFSSCDFWIKRMSSELRLVEQTQHGPALNDVVWASAVVDDLGIVIVSKRVIDSRNKIAYVYRPIVRKCSVFVATAIDLPPLNTAAGKHRTVDRSPMISPAVRIDHRRTTKLSRAHNECVLQAAPLTKIC